MKRSDVDPVWTAAESMDATVRVPPAQAKALERKRVHPEPYDRSTMFRRMAKRQIGIYRDVPVLVRRKRGWSTREALVSALSNRFPPNETSRVQVGPQHLLRRLPVREIMRRWVGGRAVVGVTDLHIRNTDVEEVIDTVALSDFNTLILGSEDLAVQEMMTLVIASRGNVTDSHSDDPAGTNHCFFGKKLWLAWDVFEGMAAGLQDVERQNVVNTARFDMRTFVELKSSRWFVVSDGDTLYLPGNFTHKVLTIEPYIGIGSFHVGLPNALDTFTRWLNYLPLWSLDDPRDDNAGLVEEALQLTLAVARRCTRSRRAAARFGYHWMAESHRAWLLNTPRPVRESVKLSMPFLELLRLARKSGDQVPRAAAPRAKLPWCLAV